LSTAPYRLFGGIVGLAVAIAALLPLVTDAELSSKVATSVLILAIGRSRPPPGTEEARHVRLATHADR
jgi:hypothetical protein